MLSLLAGKFISSKYTLAENPPITHKVYFDIEQDGGSLGRVTIGLFGTIMPNTVDNFRKFATADDSSYGYKGSIFHKAIPDFMIQGGDGEYGNKSMYGDRLTSSNTLKHDRKYRVSVATAVKTIEGSQFSITTGVVPWFSSGNAVFGEVVDGFEVVDKIGKTESNIGFFPLKEVKITASGELPVETPEEVIVDEAKGKLWFNKLWFNKLWNFERLALKQ